MFIVKSAYKEASDNSFNGTWMLIATWENTMPFTKQKNGLLPPRVRAVITRSSCEFSSQCLIASKICPSYDASTLT